MKKIKHFLSLPIRTKLLYIEAYIFLGYSRVLKMIPFVKVAPYLGQKMEETSYNINKENKNKLIEISQMIQIASKHTFWESQCLVKAMAGFFMLKRRGLDSTIYLGTKRNEEGKMIAHAWLRSGPFVLTGAEGHEHFTVVASFANRFEQLRSNINEN